MKYIIAALMGITSLVTVNQAKSNSIYSYAKVVDVTITGWVLTLTSGDSDGEIEEARIYNSSGILVREQSCSGYTCNISLVGLPKGTYTVKVTCAYAVYYESFSL